MQIKRRIHQWKHPFDDSYPFEALLCDSWQAVKLIKIEAGKVTLQFKDNHEMTLGEGLSSDVRIRSRRATVSDCSDFLRPGIEICALSSSQSSNNSNDESTANHVWLDGRINSIERKSHDSNSECTCQYYVNFYVDQGSLGAQTRTLSKDVQVVGIKEIAILQKLEHNSTERNPNPPKLEGKNVQKQHYRWESCEDCCTISCTKLIMEKFLSDLSWLVLTSVFKKVSFCARSAKNKLVYQVLGRDGATSSSSNTGSHNIISVVNFEVDKKGGLESYVSQVDLSDDTKISDHADGSNDANKVSQLRRSNRRSKQPERYYGTVGDDDVSEITVGIFRTLPYKFKKSKDDEEPSSESEEDDDNSEKLNEVSSRKRIRVSDRSRRNKKNEVKSSSEANQNEETQLVVVPVYEEGDSLAPEVHYLRVTRSKAKAKQNEQQTQLAVVPVSEESGAVALKHHHNLNARRVTRSMSKAKQNEDETQLVDVTVYEEGDSLAPKVHHRRVTRNKAEAKQNEKQTQLAIVPVSEEGGAFALKHHHNPKRRVTRSMSKAKQNKDQTESVNVPASEENDSSAPEYHQHNVRATRSEAKAKAYSSKHKLKKKMSCDMEDDVDFCPEMIGINSNQRVGKKRHRSGYSGRKSYDAEEANKARTSNAATYKKMIDSYLKEDINRKPTQEEAPIKDHLKEMNNMWQKKGKEKEVPEREEENPMSEIDMLWAEMDMALAASQLEETEDSNVPNLAETMEEPQHTCPHDYRYDEQIGIYCYRCGDVKTEIQYVTAPFMKEKRSRRKQEEKHRDGEESEPKSDEEDDFNMLPPQASPNRHISVEQDNVWGLIPELREKMHEHQRKAFEFLWENIGGSMNPSLVESRSEGIGGCVISHAPGAGKTFLIIAFLSSYLKIFPGKRPLVLAPKTTLHTWYQEFNKWETSLPVYLIHGREKHTVFDQNALTLPGVPNPGEDVRHVLDCLGKIKRWQANPSVLVMSYTKFLALMREGSEFEHRKYMAKALRESPGILILDEGHNPRSTKSRLRKGLMKVETDLRILLSGTLFQNNFCEYFNTLCLARPKFIYEVLNELDPNHRSKSNRVEKAQHLLEARARKLFLDNIAKKIDLTVGNERLRGINMLREITNGFIDVYEGGNFDSVPGLQMYTLLMNTTDTQREYLEKLGTRMTQSKRYPMEVELLITLGSIHPWLIQTVSCARKFFTSEELEQLEKWKHDLKIGTKVKFVLSLVNRVRKKEKVLFFCHNLAPVKLLIKLFERYFKWESDKEILFLNGEQELFERGKVIDKFADPRGASKVLFASITASAEGISLTSASRVVFLDSEWNPSKTKQAIARAFRPGQKKMVYVYHLLAHDTLEEEKYRKTTWKEWVSNMIFNEAFVENPLHSQADQIEDDVLREMVEEDKSKAIHMILKNEKASTN